MPRAFPAPLLAASVLALIIAGGCGDDGSPTGDGGGGFSNTLALPAGTYEVHAEFFTCESPIPYLAATDTIIACAREVADAFYGYDCPIERTGDDLSVSCRLTREVSPGCTETVVIDVAGTVSGDHYALTGTMRHSDHPADCWNGTGCDSIYATIDLVGGSPSACSYADENTAALTIAGGPQAGAHVLDAFGESSEAAGDVAFSFSAASGPVRAQAPAGGVPPIYLECSTSYIDPHALPATLAVVVDQPGAGASAATGGPEVLLRYAESTGSYGFMAEGVVAGNLVVHEIDVDHIAGTLDVTVSGTEYSEQYPGGTGAQRRLAGGYYVTNRAPLVAPGAGSLTGVLERWFESAWR